MHRIHNSGMLAHAEIVIRAPDGDGLCLGSAVMTCRWERSRLALKCRKDAIATFGFQFIDLRLKKRIVVHHRVPLFRLLQV